MTEDQLRASIRSLAVELFRLSHEVDLQPTEDEQVRDEALAIAMIARSTDRLCRHNLGGLARLVNSLLDLQGHDEADTRGAH
jgi:hypothetical protein